MNGVLGILDLAKDFDVSSTQKRLIRTALESANDLLSLVNDILDFSKIEAGRMELQSAAFDVRRTIEDVVELLSEVAQKRNVWLTCIIASDVPPRIEGDQTRVKQVLVNLVGNALKFRRTSSETL